MKRKNIIIMSVVTAVLIIGVIFLGVKAKKPANKKIETYTVAAQQKVFIDGQVTPEKSKSFYPDASKGVVHKIEVSDGQDVKEGDLLFTYKNEQITTQIEQIKSQINTAKAQTLPAGATGSANNQVSELEKQLSKIEDKEYTNVNAEFDGKIYRSNNEAQPNSPIVTLKATTFYVKGKVSEKDLHKISVGAPVSISIISLNKSVNGKIRSIGDRPLSAEVTQLNGNVAQNNVSYYEVNMECDTQQNLTDGFHVQADYKLKSDPIKVPNTSIIKENGKSFVYKVVNKKLTKHVITVEKSQNNFSTIKSGLKENDTVVKNATKELKEGQSVE